MVKLTKKQLNDSVECEKMTKKEAIDTLIALACCSDAMLTCEDCPFYVESESDEPDMSTCKTDRKDIVRAVRTLKAGESK